MYVLFLSFSLSPSLHLSPSLPPLSLSLSPLSVADLAAKLKVRDRVVVEETEQFGVRMGVIAYVGKVPEIAPGFWVGIVFDKSDGKNDGSIRNSVGGITRYFTCDEGHGSFLRPNKIKQGEREGGEASGGGNPPSAPKAKEGGGGAAAAGGGGGGRRGSSVGSVAMSDDAATTEGESDDKVKQAKKAAKLSLKGVGKEKVPRSPTARMGGDTPKAAPLAEPQLLSPKSADRSASGMRQAVEVVSTPKGSPTKGKKASKGVGSGKEKGASPPSSARPTGHALVADVQEGAADSGLSQLRQSIEVSPPVKLKSKKKGKKD